MAEDIGMYIDPEEDFLDLLKEYLRPGWQMPHMSFGPFGWRHSPHVSWIDPFHRLTSSPLDPAVYLISGQQPTAEPSRAHKELQKAYEKLLARYRFLVSLFGGDPLSQELARLFAPEQKRSRVLVRFESTEDAGADDYATLFRVLSSLNRLMLSVTSRAHFIKFWLQGERGEIALGDRFKVLRIVKASPGEIEGSALTEVAKSLGQVLSLGNQVTNFRMSGIKVRDAKVDLEKKEIELEEQRRRAAAKSRTSDLDEEIERERKKAELEELRKKRDEAVRERRKLMMEDISQQFDLLSKTITVLSSLPPEMQGEFKAALFNELDELRGTALTITEVRLLDHCEGKDQTDGADAAQAK